MSKLGAAFYASLGLTFSAGGLTMCWMLAVGWGFPAESAWDILGIVTVWLIPLAITFLGFGWLAQAYAYWTGMELPELDGT